MPRACRAECPTSEESGDTSKVFPDIPRQQRNVREANLSKRSSNGRSGPETEVVLKSTYGLVLGSRSAREHGRASISRTRSGTTGGNRRVKNDERDAKDLQSRCAARHSVRGRSLWSAVFDTTGGHLDLRRHHGARRRFCPLGRGLALMGTAESIDCLLPIERCDQQLSWPIVGRRVPVTQTRGGQREQRRSDARSV